MDEIGRFFSKIGNVSNVIGDKGVKIDVAVRLDSKIYTVLPLVIIVSGVSLIFLSVLIKNWLAK